MSGIEELVVATAEAYAAAKEIKDGIVESWDKLSEAYSYITSFFVTETSTGKYNNITEAAKVWAMLWITPLDMARFLFNMNSRNTSDNADRAMIYTLISNVQARPAWVYGLRYPNAVCLPLLGTDYKDSFMGIYSSLNSISLCIKYNNSKNLENYIDNYNNYLNELNTHFSRGSAFADRDKLELNYGLKWLRD